MRWMIAAAVAAVAIAAAWVLFVTVRIAPTSALALTHTERAALRLTLGHTQELAMRDLAPLFLPTKYNAGSELWRTPPPGSEYFARDPNEKRGLHFPSENIALTLPPTVRLPGGAVEALANPPAPLAAGIGRSDGSVPVAAPSGGHVDVYGDGAADAVLSVALDPEARAPIATYERRGWRPLEFSANVDAVGLVGPLQLTTSSGVTEIDEYFRIYLARSFRLGDRLPPGWYRVVVGP
jgi:hypothetical protein